MARPFGAHCCWYRARVGRARILAAVMAAALALAGCGSAAAHGPGASSVKGAATSGTDNPLPAGKTPSSIAVMVCATKAQTEIADALGLKAHVSKPTWVDHLYMCHYDYSGASFTMSVKELSSWSQTYSYFDGEKTSLGDKGSLGNLGQGAFTTDNGGIIVRKDWKVLYVNISSLPAMFGRPKTTRAEVAVTIASIILGCWAGD